MFLAVFSPHVEPDFGAKCGTARMSRVCAMYNSRITCLSIATGLVTEGRVNLPQKGSEGIYDRLCTRLTSSKLQESPQVLPVGVKFKATTNSRQCLLRTSYKDESVLINNTFFFLESASEIAGICISLMCNSNQRVFLSCLVKSCKISIMIPKPCMNLLL